LVLRSALSDIARLHAWIDDLSSRHAIPENNLFAISICLEEALANVILHGYAGAQDRSILVRFTIPRTGYFVFIIEDEAPRFNPLEAPEMPPLDPQQEIRVGGQGIRFLRRFADTIKYEPTANGNRLSIGFSSAGAALGSK
jgi:serine/threonine-protein kinase RsbW